MCRNCGGCQSGSPVHGTGYVVPATNLLLLRYSTRPSIFTQNGRDANSLAVLLGVERVMSCAFQRGFEFYASSISLFKQREQIVKGRSLGQTDISVNIALTSPNQNILAGHLVF